MRSVHLLAPLIGFGLLLTACPSDKHRIGTGELGKGDLHIVCTDDDAACVPGEQRIAATHPIAVGASFAVAYAGPIPKAATGAQSTAILFSGSPEMFSRDDDRFSAWLPGTGALLVRTDQGTVLDFVHLRIADVERIELNCATKQLVVGQELVCDATPFGSEALLSNPDQSNPDQSNTGQPNGEQPSNTSSGTPGNTLAGSLNYLWNVEGTAVEIVKKESRFVTLIAKEAGDATLQASSGDAMGEAIFRVEVAP